MQRRRRSDRMNAWVLVRWAFGINYLTICSVKLGSQYFVVIQQILNDKLVL
jgi:hypothetical protein